LFKDAEMKAKVWTIQVYNEEKRKVFVKIDIIKNTKKGFFFFFFLQEVSYLLFTVSVCGNLDKHFFYLILRLANQIHRLT